MNQQKQKAAAKRISGNPLLENDMLLWANAFNINLYDNEKVLNDNFEFLYSDVMNDDMMFTNVLLNKPVQWKRQ